MIKLTAKDGNLEMEAVITTEEEAHKDVLALARFLVTEEIGRQLIQVATTIMEGRVKASEFLDSRKIDPDTTSISDVIETVIGAHEIMDALAEDVKKEVSTMIDLMREEGGIEVEAEECVCEDCKRERKEQKAQKVDTLH